MKKITLFLVALFAPILLWSQPWLKNVPQEKIKNNSVNFYDLQSAFNQYWGDRPIIGSKGWKPFKRWEWFMEQRVFPDGNLSNTVYWNELQKKQKEKNPSTDAWQFIGPSTLPTQINYDYTTGLGRVNCIAFHPTNQDIMWAGTPAGGIWKTSDGGQTWNNNALSGFALGISDIAIDPTNPNTMYAATGDKDGLNTYSAGVLKTTDGGQTWTATGLSYQQDSLIIVTRILIRNDNANVVIAATNKGIFKSENAGTSWVKVKSGHVMDLEFKPLNNNIIYASEADFAPTNGNAKIYKSTDGGNTFAECTTGLDIAGNVQRIELAVTQANAEVVYAVAVKTSDDGLLGVYKSDNSAASWTKVTSSPNLLGTNFDGSGAAQGWYDLALAVSPSNASEIYVGGVNVWKSTNNGSSWKPITYWDFLHNTPFVHVDHHSLTFSPTGILFAAHDGGISKTDNSGTTWTEISNGLQISQIYRISTSPINTNYMTVGTQDIGTLRNHAGKWVEILGGDGMENIIDYTNENIIYAEMFYGTIKKSINGGKEFFDVKPTNSGSGAWVTPFIMHPKNHNTLFIGYNDVFKTINQAKTWQKISNFGNSKPLNALAIAPSNDNYLYASSENKIWRTSDGGSTWKNISSGLPNKSITCIAISQNDPSKVWISFSGYDAGQKVYYSDNAGLTWTNISANLPNVPANTIVFENNNPDNMVYVGTDLGAYYRNAKLNNWTAVGTNLTNVIISDLEINYASHKLVAGTYGRGLWQIELITLSTESPIAGFSAKYTSISAGSKVKYTNESYKSPVSCQWTFTGGTPATSTATDTVTVTYNTVGLFPVSLTATNTNGSDTETKDKYMTVFNGNLILEEPLNLQLSVDSNDISMKWNQPRSGFWFSYVNTFELNWLDRATFQRGVKFHLPDFNSNYPATINKIAHYFCQNPNDPWLDATYKIKIYANDGIEVLDSSDWLEATSCEQNYYILENPIVVTNDIYVMIQPQHASGFPASYCKSASASNNHSYYNKPGNWLKHTTSELFTSIFVLAQGKTTELKYYDNRELTAYKLYKGGTPIKEQTDTVFTDRNLTDGTYNYYVTALYGDLGESYPSNIELTKINTQLPPTVNAGTDFTISEGRPANLSATATDKNNNPLSYSWTAPQGITLNNSNSLTPSFTAPTVTANSVYSFAFKANDGTYNSDADTVKVTVLNDAAINTIATLKHFDLYPNPSTGKVLVNFEMLEKTNLNLIIYNNIGQIVLSKNYGISNTINETLDLNKNQDGVYNLMIMTDKGKASKKLILQK